MGEEIDLDEVKIVRKLLSKPGVMSPEFNQLIRALKRAAKFFVSLLEKMERGEKV